MVHEAGSRLFLIFYQPCIGYGRRVTHDEIADCVGKHVREILGTRANLTQISQKEQRHAAKASTRPKRCSLR
jgi:hypothetical protein